MLRALGCVVLIVDALGPRGRGEVCVRGLARSAGHGAGGWWDDVFEVQGVDERPEAVGHGGCGVGVDDEDGAGFAHLGCVAWGVV